MDRAGSAVRKNIGAKVRSRARMTVIDVNEALSLKQRRVQNSMTARIRSGCLRMLGFATHERMIVVRSDGMQG